MPESSRALRDLAAAVGGSVEGNAEKRIDGVAPLETASATQIAFLANMKYRDQAIASKAGAILAPFGVDLGGRDVVRVPDPYLAVAKILDLFHPPSRHAAGVREGARVGSGCVIDPSAAILPGAVLGDRVRVGAGTVVHSGVVVGDDCAIGSNCVLHPNVTLYARTVVGNRAIVHAGAVIGSDGFGFAHDGTAPVKVPQIGNVIVEDDVEIGANTTVDRATFGSTIIRRGAKIDNLVQVAHNVEVGEGSILVAQSGISGSTKLGRGVIFAGQSGAVGHISIGDGSKVGAKAAVTHDLPAGSFVIGHPAVDARIWRRAATAFAKLPGMLRRLRALERAAGARSKGEGEEE